MPTTIGVPVKLLHECEGHKISVELQNGELYRGTLVDAEDCMNLQMQQVVSEQTMTGENSAQ
jgi:small nuclear ribonucleoprotein D3